ncbi:magnesium transporter [Solitalea canadensis]|uniref:Magnesium transporter MgtE n=1 Tax=Solitalea canadensis (strain ATCC 29591 / DSM 3403 / JCM 21819 / LMG 8368 / NBRC 15130 / NCIMB 12057 / USAM 9D) TaxID=929556 RepID=H8KVM0_SOLCM|nr:magnesium transporter [Solitalea canadensis]AFD06523.1 Mg2+ transporter MgtE [Solitalea canadensis DSM 3403]
MIETTQIQEILELIEQKKFFALRKIIKDWHPSELAELFEDIPLDDRAIVFRVLPRDLASNTFEYLDIKIQKDLMKGLGQERVADILNEMWADDRTALFEELPGPVVKQLLELLSPEERRVASTLLGYPENTVGRLMLPNYISVKEYWTVERVLDHIRRYGHLTESLGILYVIDGTGRLIDEIRINDILLAPLDTKVNELMDGNFVYLHANDDKEAAIEVFKQYDRVSLPVVNSDNILIGIVTVDDMLDIVEEEDTEDIQKFGGLEALEAPYLDTPLWEMIKKRAGWLVILFVGEMLTATAMSYFEHEIEKAVVLALFVPLIISSGGNSGSQAATLIIRSLALGEVTLSQWWKVMRKEIISGILLGSILGVIGFIRIGVAELIIPGLYGDHFLLIGLVVGLSLIGVVLWGSLSGSMLPFMLRRLGFDPATSSAPFVATLVDVTGLVIYFTVASAILKGILL